MVLTLHERQRGLSRELVVLRKTTKCGEGRSRQQRLILTLGPRPSASPSTVCYELPVAEGLSESLVQDDRIAHSSSYGRSSTSRRLACGAVMHFPNEHNRLRIRLRCSFCVLHFQKLLRGGPLGQRREHFHQCRLEKNVLHCFDIC